VILRFCSSVHILNTWQVEAEKKAAAAAQEGNAKRLRDAEARVESLEETVEELRVAMDRQRAAADLR